MARAADRKSAGGRLAIGTSGWSYAGWRNSFYPAGCPAKSHLAYYGSRFLAAEINSSFYRTPTLAAVASWRDQTPDGFTFSWKASRFITHWKRLNDTCASSLALMQTRLDVLGPKLAAVLFQLPPHMAKDEPRLEAFLAMLSPKQRYAIEFRHMSWYGDRVFDILAAHGVALCVSDHADAPSPWRATAAFIYIRGHGPSGRYSGRYAPATLRRWAREIRRWRSERKDVLVYFDNDQKAAAPKDAAQLIKMLRSGA